MNVKRYLTEIRKLDRKISNKQLELESLKALVISITPKLKEANVQSGSSQDRLGDTIAKILDLQNAINLEIDKYVDRKLEAIRLINLLEDDISVNILIQRYINYKHWEEIGESLGYSRQWIIKKHGKALLDFEKVYTRVYKSLH